ncbi:flagellar protein FlgN [Bdellovibrio bacteriovorus]|uniref:flagellar protein FlgN n=1 Tax=Bdellovibrio bacteriovorus TaxID=959 RepID=UPI0035A6B8B2
MDATIERAFHKLESNLEELTKIYRSLLDIVRKEKEILLKADRDALDESNKLKEELLFKLRAQDSLRSRYAMELATLVGADTENPRLLELAQKLAGTPAADRLRTQHAALDILIKRITEINKENEEYTKSALYTERRFEQYQRHAFRKENLRRQGPGKTRPASRRKLRFERSLRPPA